MEQRINLQCLVCGELFEGTIDFLIAHDLVCCPHCNKSSECDTYLKQITPKQNEKTEASWDW